MQDKILKVRREGSEVRVVFHMGQGSELVAITIQEGHVYGSSSLGIWAIAGADVEGTLPAFRLFTSIVQVSRDLKRFRIGLGQTDPFGQFTCLARYPLLMLL